MPYKIINGSFDHRCIPKVLAGVSLVLAQGAISGVMRNPHPARFSAG